MYLNSAPKYKKEVKHTHIEEHIMLVVIRFVLIIELRSQCEIKTSKPGL